MGEGRKREASCVGNNVVVCERAFASVKAKLQCFFETIANQYFNPDDQNPFWASVFEFWTPKIQIPSFILSIRVRKANTVN